LFAETKNFVLCAILLSWLVSELQKLSSLGLQPGTDFQDFGLRSCNNFALDAAPLSILVFKLQEPSSSVLWPLFLWSIQYFFQSFENFFLFSRSKHANFGAYWFTHSCAISKHTHARACAYTHTRFNFRYEFTDKISDKSPPTQPSLFGFMNSLVYSTTYFGLKWTIFRWSCVKDIVDWQNTIDIKITIKVVKIN
jgi:hypothetical protein